MVSKVKIRLANPCDAPELKLLNDMLNGMDLSTVESVEDSIKSNKNEIVAVAEFDGKIIGQCCGQIIWSICYKIKYGEITEFFVHPDYRRQGIGKLLIEFVQNELVKIGITDFYLYSGASNETAHKFYRSAGFIGKQRMFFEKSIKREENK
jgi:ribosomal protein S18 acetylase RimI-like enzyme